MKRFNFFLVSCFLATCMCLAVGYSKNKTAHSAPDDSVPDPAGTLTVNISKNKGASIGKNGSIRIHWTSPNKLVLYGSSYRKKRKERRCNVSICNLGAMSGLGNITKIPASGYTAPSLLNSSVACEAGHGYVVKIEKQDESNSEYIRLYVVEPIVSAADGITGAKVKYQYPFVP